MTPDQKLKLLQLQQQQAKNANPSGVMAQVNRGISDSIGGLVDFINPFDEPHALNPFKEGTGSAKAGIRSAMEAGGIDVAQGDPETVWQSFSRGAGEAAGALIPVAKGLQSLRGMGGAVGAFADDAVKALSTIPGVGGEVFAGGLSESARKKAEQEGAPEWVQNSVAIAAPMSVPAAASTANAALKLAGRAPLASMAVSAAKGLKAAAAPYTKSGAEVVASKRLVDLAGGPDRAAELRSRISGDNPLKLTPAQQTGDQNMIAVEQLAAAQDPNIRSRLEQRADDSLDAARRAIQSPGDIQDTRQFFAARRKQFAADLRARADNAIKKTGKAVGYISPQRSEGENALQVSLRIMRELEAATAQEADLWARVPMGETVPTSAAKATAQRLMAETPRAQQNDIPKVLRDLLSEGGGFADVETVSEMHGLYSELRRVARSAMAGNDQNKNMARIANETASAILRDMGAIDGSTEAGRAINEARAFSSALHETFDRGAVGRLLKKTLDGDTAIDPELSLARTVKRGGVEGAVAARQIEDASPNTGKFISDYLRQRFQEATVTPTGEFNNASAQKFMRDNSDLLDRYPGLRDDIRDAVSERDTADKFAQRIEDRIAATQNAKISAGQAILNGSPDSAIRAFTEARNPVAAARRLVNEARKDETGAAMAGLKSLLSSELIKKSGLSGEGLRDTIADPKLKAAFRQVFSADEMSRLTRMARDLDKLGLGTGPAPSIGSSLSGATPNKLIEYAARVIAAKHGAGLGGGGGGSLQTAQMASSRMKEILGRLTADRASQMLADAVEDPELFRALLSDIRSVKAEKAVINRALPYLIGAGAASSLNNG